MIRVVRLSTALLAITLVSGCATSRYCMGDQPYQQAITIPALTGTPDLHLPESQAALRVPEVAADSLPYGRLITDADGDAKALCLDSPPRLAELPPKPEEPAAEKAEPSAES